MKFVIVKIFTFSLLLLLINLMHLCLKYFFQKQLYIMSNIIIYSIFAETVFLVFFDGYKVQKSSIYLKLKPFETLQIYFTLTFAHLMHLC